VIVVGGLGWLLLGRAIAAARTEREASGGVEVFD
jgi:hypothetical protein